jgi:nitrite reductase/ring-hydroxylating ferredoxin subunit
MADPSDPTLRDRWFPIASGAEVVPRHVVQAQLLGQEIALWRDDAGALNAWENRCPHRGVRLSIGFNTGTELRCQYHGWRYASSSGQCTYIPAHPDQKPPNVIRATRYGVAERYGLVWVSLGQRTEQADLPALGLNRWTNLRSIFVEARLAVVRDALLLEGAVAADDFMLQVENVTLALQPLNDGQTIIHALLADSVAEPERLATLRLHNARLKALRDAIERLAS